MKHLTYDVIVVGGGSAGICAAVQAARAGAHTLLLEKSGILGGTTVLAGVNFPGLFHAWGKQVIAGIGWELTHAAVREMGQSLPDFSQYKTLKHWQMQIPVDKAVYAALADELVVNSGVDLQLHTMVGEVVYQRTYTTADGEKENLTPWYLITCGKEGMRRVRTRTLIDCTGDANIIRMAGYPLRRSTLRQPGTLVMDTPVFDYDKLDWEVIEANFRAAVEAGTMLATDFHRTGNPVKSFLHSRGRNSMHVVDIDGETSAGKTTADLKARAAMLRIIRFLRAQPGLEDFELLSFATECGIRETAIIEGEADVALADYTSGRIWSDAVCNSFYPIDLHRPEGHGIDFRVLREPDVPTIPLRALLPKGSRHLLAAGRIASGDQLANSAYRVQASCMAMGQAAGAVAALSALSGKELRDVPLEDIRALLRQNAAIVPEVPAGDAVATAAEVAAAKAEALVGIGASV
ncbi:FAD-dependent oxidoreductase [Verrucomicrobia bacterium LW23]|nr:FAD-dependent oxidoreductase [Verrucomicrobia bacterium LW23]